MPDSFVNFWPKNEVNLRKSYKRNLVLRKNKFSLKFLGGILSQFAIVTIW